ncbi:hypothetical protein PMAYCL1PPCAC_10768, partial [Pristionchus mayeri]
PFQNLDFRLVRSIVEKIAMEELRNETPDLFGIAITSFERILINLDKELLMQLRAVSHTANSRVSAYVQHYYRPVLHSVNIERCTKKRTRAVKGRPENINAEHVFTIENRDCGSTREIRSMRRMAMLPLMRIADEYKLSKQSKNYCFCIRLDSENRNTLRLTLNGK